MNDFREGDLIKFRYVHTPSDQKYLVINKITEDYIDVWFTFNGHASIISLRYDETFAEKFYVYYRWED